MILYVESNFILELAFLQSEHSACTTLMELAAHGEITLVLPAFCIGETFEVLTRRKKQRYELHRLIRDGTNELSRSAPYQASATAIQELMEIFRSSAEEEQQRLELTLGEVLNIAVILPVDAIIIRDAITLQKERDLTPQDSVIYASILSHLPTAPETTKCFVTKNAKDFDSPEVRGDLASHDCQLLTKFTDGLGYLRRKPRAKEV